VEGFITSIPLHVQNEVIKFSDNVLPISGADIILGAAWLATLGPHIAGYSSATIKFYLDKKFITLTGDNFGHPHMPNFITLNVYQPLMRLEILIPLIFSMDTTPNDTLQLPDTDPHNLATVLHGKDHGEYIRQSIDEGPIKMGRCRDEIASGTDGPYLGPKRDKVVADLSQAEKDRLRADIRSELTEDDRKSQLYDEFEHFGQHKGENIHDYYVRFTKIINDMRHIKMTMPKIQLNSKFVNNMLPKWSRFVTAVKLNRGLKEPNHDQLYAYLNQHELHAKENKMLMERLNQHSHDPLALVSNVSPYQYPLSSLVPP
ncbi:hypothetical protein Tco_0753127, partial [Tanacetum coccineum]